MAAWQPHGPSARAARRFYHKTGNDGNRYMKSYVTSPMANIMKLESRTELVVYNGGVTFSPTGDSNAYSDNVMQFFACALNLAHDTWKGANPQAKLVKAKLMIFDPATERPIPPNDTTRVGWLVITREAKKNSGAMLTNCLSSSHPRVKCRGWTRQG